MARTAVLCAGPGALLAWSWLRLGQPRAGASTALWLIALAVAPALLPRARWRAFAVVPAAVLALHSALGVWIVCQPKVPAISTDTRAVTSGGRTAAR